MTGKRPHRGRQCSGGERWKNRGWDKTDWKARADLLAGLRDGIREDARRYRHLMWLAEPHADGWRIELPGDMPLDQAIDTDMQTRAVLRSVQRGARGGHCPAD